VLGWREWVALPELDLPAIKAKIDTGARTSALHAVKLKRFRRRGRPWVRFEVHPHQDDVENSVVAEALIIDERDVRSSSGKAEQRPVILARVNIGATTMEIELTLTNRALMGFRMLLGREAMRNRFLVNPGRSFCQRDVTSSDESPPLPAPSVEQTRLAAKRERVRKFVRRSAKTRSPSEKVTKRSTTKKTATKETATKTSTKETATKKSTSPGA